ncbi:hypothetical protein Q644_09410 [Brucella intermedia 229E]|uniref:Uncharacterized protein n=1 Tax=Brucella intermedia 229E TaxID=1337887 RepID=U4V148_9HYPH|nr:hypothetical protein Q644_09410 [Brucella intermedia 229E]
MAHAHTQLILESSLKDAKPDTQPLAAAYMTTLRIM